MMTRPSPLARLLLLSIPLFACAEAPSPEDPESTSAALSIPVMNANSTQTLTSDVTVAGDFKVYAVSFPTNVIFASGITS
ncbi:MAG TPA: hypothetical protein VN914_09420, partial [Polyangia bacterium]|nr:hypothetical protein [Polyangia bacterium]